MELASISGLEREKGRQYIIYVSVNINVPKYLCIDLQLAICFKSDAPENRSVKLRNPLIQDSMLHDTLNQLWFLKGFFDLVPIFIKLQLDHYSRTSIYDSFWGTNFYTLN